MELYIDASVRDTKAVIGVLTDDNTTYTAKVELEYHSAPLAEALSLDFALSLGNLDGRKKMIIYTDSAYVVSMFNKLKAMGVGLLDKRKFKHSEKWRSIINKAVRYRDVQVVKVTGHSDCHKHNIIDKEVRGTLRGWWNSENRQ